MTESALEKAFRYFGPNHSAANLRAAARELLAERRAFRASIARRLKERRAEFMRACRESGIAPDRPLRASLSRTMREDMTRHVPRRATLPSLRRELASLRAAEMWRRSDSYRARLNSLPCGLQDSEDYRRAEDESLARILRHAIRIIERESR